VAALFGEQCGRSVFLAARLTVHFQVAGTSEQAAARAAAAARFAAIADKVAPDDFVLK
jgi:hypothetical protein